MHKGFADSDHGDAGCMGGLLAALLAAQACLACFATKLHLAGGASRWGSGSSEV